MEDVLLEVPVDEVRVSPFQPRRYFSEQELKYLADSIKSVGLIHPPVVRSVSNKNKHLYYELITGERRWRAVQLLGRTSIQVLVRDSEDLCAAEASLTENLQRVDLNPIETAEAMKKFMDMFRLTQDKLAVKVGKKRSTVANYLRLLTLDEEIKKLLASGELTMGHAKIILSLSSIDRRDILKEEIIKNKLAVRAAEEVAKRLMRSSAKSERNVAELTDRERKIVDLLETHFPVKANVKMTNNGNMLTLSYTDDSVLDDIIEKLMTNLKSTLS